MTGSQDATRSYAKKRLAVVLLGGVAGVAIGLAGVYGIGHLAGNAGPDPACKATIETARRMAPLARGEVAAVGVAQTPKALPVLAFKDAAGADKSLADWRGRTVLLNLWATWCVPCVTEMPTLDAAAKDMAVVTVSQDLGDDARAKVTAFMAKGHYTHLKPYLDPKANLSVAYNASLPTSILYDSAGHVVWRMTGGMDWTTGTARELLAEAH